MSEADAPRLKTKNVNSKRIFISSFTLNWLTLTYKPRLQTQTTFNNFAVTRDGLEDQLLAEVVNARLTKNISAKPAPTTEKYIIPQGTLENSTEMTGEPPTRMLANLHAALHGFDQFCLVGGKKKEEKEDMRMCRTGMSQQGILMELLEYSTHEGRAGM
ncbi:dynein axonemal heavy chain 11-like [Zonotrichia leucophrys gambelii]|uniref:dynein axonemal heavy chain 11-like n=1 Tax=Zonotrichia leucophrys gambelii TaxID=257770 RepID=UPI0031405676